METDENDGGDKDGKAQETDSEKEWGWGGGRCVGCPQWMQRDQRREPRERNSNVRKTKEWLSAICIS